MFSLGYVTNELFIVGANGRTVRLWTQQAIARGHSVTALVRTPESLSPHAHLQIVVGDPTCVDDLAHLLSGHDADISCLGQRSRADARLLQNAAAAMLEAMARSGVRQYLVMSQGLLFPS